MEKFIIITEIQNLFITSGVSMCIEGLEKEYYFYSNNFIKKLIELNKVIKNVKNNNIPNSFSLGDVNHIIKVKGTSTFIIFEQEIQLSLNAKEFLRFVENIINPLINLFSLFLRNFFGIKRIYILKKKVFGYECSLIEIAMKSILKFSEHSLILPIITPKDFISCEDFSVLHKNSKYPIYKLHGSVKNVITNDDTRTSLIATTTALGKNKLKDETFSIEPYKHKRLQQLLKNRTLIVLGYSASDQFDLIPSLQIIEGIDKIIWIDHKSDENLGFFKIKTSSYQNTKYKNVRSKTIEFLSNWFKKNKKEVYYFTGSTQKIIKKLFPSLFQNESLFFKPESISDMLYSLKNWLINEFQSILSINKNKFATSLYFTQGNFDNAEIIINRYLSNFVNKIDHIDMAFFQNLSGRIKSAKGLYESALVNFRTAYDLSQNLEYLSNLCSVNVELGKLDDALDIYKKILNLFENSSDLLKKANLLNNIASIFEIRGDYSKSLEYYERTIEIIEKLGDLTLKAGIINNIGMINYNKGNFQKALSKFQEAVKIDDELGDIWGKAIHLNNIGLIFYSLNDINNALQYYQESLKIEELLNNLTGKAKVLANIGQIFEEIGNLNEALIKYTDALKINEELGNQHTIATDLNDIGLLHQKKGNLSNALEMFSKELEIGKNLKSLSIQATAIDNIGLCYHMNKKLDKALKYYNDSRLILEKINDRIALTTNLSNTAYIFKEKGDFNLALEYMKKSIEITEDLGLIKNLNEKKTILEQWLLEKSKLEENTTIPSIKEVLYLQNYVQKLKNLENEINRQNRTNIINSIIQEIVNLDLGQFIYSSLVIIFNNWKNQDVNLKDQIRKLINEIGKLVSSISNSNISSISKFILEGIETNIKNINEILEKIEN